MASVQPHGKCTVQSLPPLCHFCESALLGPWNYCDVDFIISFYDISNKDRRLEIIQTAYFL